MQRLLAELTRAHFPNPPATPEQIASFEALMGWRLDTDLRAFYLHCDGAALFSPRTEDPNYRLLSLAEIQETLVRVRRRDQGAVEAASWYPVVDCQDSDYVLVDVARPGGPYRLLDAWHETYPRQVKQIASSFSEFLGKALASNDHLYWLYE